MNPDPASKNSKCNNFIATVRVNIFSVDQAEKWKTDFEKSSFSDYRVMKTFGKLDTSNRVVFKVCVLYTKVCSAVCESIQFLKSYNLCYLYFQKKYRCHHNTLAEKSGSKVAHEKHTNCPAELTSTVRNSEMKWYHFNCLTIYRNLIIFGTIVIAFLFSLTVTGALITC